MTNQTLGFDRVAVPLPRTTDRRIATRRPVPASARQHTSVISRIVLVTLAAFAAVAMIASAPATVLVPILTVLGVGSVASLVIARLDDRGARRGGRGRGARAPITTPSRRWNDHARRTGASRAHLPSRYFRALPFHPEAV